MMRKLEMGSNQVEVPYIVVWVDVESFVKASSVEELKPHFFNEGLAFMFESKYLLKVSNVALQSPTLQANYIDCWKDMPVIFDVAKGTKPQIDWSQFKK